MIKVDEFKIYKDCVKDMIKNHEDGDYIRIYINDLYRGKDITAEQRQELVNLMMFTPITIEHKPNTDLARVHCGISSTGWMNELEALRYYNDQKRIWS